MKHLLLAVLSICILFSCSNNTEPNTTENVDTPTAEAKNEVVPETPKKVSKYKSLSETIYVGKISPYQEKLFANLITPKQEEQANRSDTLFTVSFIPYKDQELYLYQSNSESSSKWNLSIIKNGEVIVNEYLITENNFAMLKLNKMEVGDKDMTFEATKADGTTETISVPYDGKHLEN